VAADRDMAAAPIGRNITESSVSVERVAYWLFR
jgi:hypothetical protein